jgi:GWxTD domain-containing protein
MASVALLLGGPSGASADGGLDIRIVRLSQQEGQKTRVKAFVEVPFASFQVARDGRLSLQAVARVTDSAGTLLSEDKWPMRPKAPGALDDLYSVEIFDFAVVAGKYQLSVAVLDSVSGRTLTGTASFEGFGASPEASDLLLAPLMRPVQAADTTKPGEWKYGDATMVTAAATVRLTADTSRTKLYYLVEAYSDKADSGTMTVTVLDSAAVPVVQTRPRPMRIDAGGGVMKGKMDLAGLPGGPYLLAVDLDLGGHTIRRTAPFRMGALEEAALRAVADRQTDDGYFGAMREKELDRAEEPLIYLQEKNELSVYKGLSVAAKAKFLAEFWRRRDPTPQTPINEAREQFYRAIQTANQRFGEEGRDIEQGWRTDRGRIFLKRGDPLETKRREAKGRQPALWMWSYAEHGRWYIFADNSNNNVYRLIASSDLNEPGQSNWYEQFDKESLVELGQYLGVDFFTKYQIPR